MSLIGIHTPTKDIIQKTYPGLCMNSKYCRIVKQDVVLACASMMPFSADIVGTGADDISPEDAFNPILYKAVSNESMSTIEARLAGLGTFNASAKGPSVTASNEDVTLMSDEFNVYYSLLSNRDGFRTANPQQGLQMKGLVPLVFEKYYNYGINKSAAKLNGLDSIPMIADNSQHTALTIGTTNVLEMRGKAHPMPRFNTTYITSATGAYTSGQNDQNGMGDGKPYNAQVEMPNLMPVYTALIIVPPKRLHSLYYRLVVRTTLEFTEVRPIQEIASFASLDSDYATLVYHSDYADQSSKMTSTAGMVDAKDADITKIMEGA